ncbi:hypothetical protein [Streptomyces sp. NPDC056512]|uniref:hypothetical protein n=1 Tax=Streptomyces sp. NPDC056512 TaxID=3345846 RepID=UPI0036973C37
MTTHGPSNEVAVLAAGGIVAVSEVWLVELGVNRKVDAVSPTLDAAVVPIEFAAWPRVGEVPALKTIATQYHPGVRLAETGVVFSPADVMAESAFVLPMRLPDESYRPTQFCPAVALAPAVVTHQYTFAIVARLRTYTLDR